MMSALPGYNKADNLLNIDIGKNIEIIRLSDNHRCERNSRMRAKDKNRSRIRKMREMHIS
jgi:hypothetical protein